MPGDQILSTTEIKSLHFAQEPAFQMIESLLVLARFDHLGGLSARLQKIHDQMSEREIKRNCLVTVGFFGAIIPQKSWKSFPDYLNYLTTIDPRKLQKRLLDYIEQMFQNQKTQSPLIKDNTLDRERLLNNQSEYIALLKNELKVSQNELGMEVQAHSYLTDPPAMQDLIIEHLNHMWDTYFAEEWEATAPLIQKSIEAFNSLSQKGLDRLAIIEQVADGRLVEQLKQVGALEYFLSIPRLVMIPSPHLGPYYGKFRRGDTLWYLFGAHVPEGADTTIPELDLADVNMRLTALADDTRLRILQYLVAHDGKTSNEIIQALSLSQSAASRHLKQLSITGYLKERREGCGKSYSLNTKRIKQTMRAVEKFLLEGGQSNT